MSFETRCAALPELGLGISTEFGAGETGLDVFELRARHPGWGRFLEVGADLERGLDATARLWARRGYPTTLHFLDLNLEEPEDLDAAWLAGIRKLAEELGAAWLCGDAGLWHIGPREPGHGTLMPPVLCDASARTMAAGVRALREATGLEVLPENPPAHVYLGDLHLLDYFARVAEAADCGLLLDVSHLAIYQRAMGHRVLDGLDALPWERVLEIHIAGGTEFEHDGRRFVDDDHSPEPISDSWTLLEAVLPRALRLRALVYECERNPLALVTPHFTRLEALVGSRFEPAA